MQRVCTPRGGDRDLQDLSRHVHNTKSDHPCIPAC